MTVAMEGNSGVEPDLETDFLICVTGLADRDRTWFVLGAPRRALLA